MMNPFKQLLRLLPLALVMALVLAFATVSLVSASAVASRDDSPSTSCLSVKPAFQTVEVNKLAKLTISPSGCTLPPQQFADANIVVAWGDGSVSSYVYCLEVCYASISASHTYTAVGDYHPSICLTVPPPSATTPVACTSVEIEVVYPPAA